MVSNDFNSVRDTFEVMTPFLEGSKDRKKFLVVNFIVEFGGRHRTREKGNRMHERCRRVDLGEYCGDCVVRGVGLDDGRSIGMVVGENGSTTKVALEFVECLRTASIRMTYPSW